MSGFSRLSRAAAVLAMAAVSAPLVAQQGGTPLEASLWKSLSWRHIGPQGNRVMPIAGVPGDPMVYYAGAVSGGVFKTTDGGAHWDADLRRPAGVVDRVARRRALATRTWSGRARASRSSAATSPSATASTSRPTPGRPGPTRPRQDGPDRAHPDPPEETPTSSSPARWATPTARSRSAASSVPPTVGRTGSRCCSWTRTPGCSDVAMDPTNPRILFAGMWQIEIHTWGRKSGGDGQRPVQVDRRRRHLEAARRQRSADQARRQGFGAGGRAQQPEPRLRPDRDRRRHAPRQGQPTESG